MVWGKKKEPPVSSADAARMTPRQIVKLFKQGRTVTGFSPEQAEHLGNGDLKNKPIKDIDKGYARRGSFDMEGTLKKRGDFGGLLAGLKGGGRNTEAPPVWNGRGKPPPPPRRTGFGSSGRQVARPLSETMSPDSYRKLLQQEAKRQKLL